MPWPRPLRDKLSVSLRSCMRNSMLCSVGQVRPRDWPNGRERSCSWRTGILSPRWATSYQCNAVIFTSGLSDSDSTGSQGFTMGNGPADRRSFPPEVAIHLVKIACERPDDVGRSLSHWDCTELARQLVADEVVDSISSQTVQRILAGHKLKPWRKHLWLSSGVPRDADFCTRVKNI